MKMFCAACVSAILIIIGSLFILRRLISLHIQRISIHQTPSAVHQLLNPPNASDHELLESRARPNERLIKAFALTNTFVSSSVQIHTTFVKRAKSLLYDANKHGWKHFQTIAIESVELALPHAGERKNFDAFVQDVTMRVALVAILAIDRSVADLDPEDIQVASILITRLWSLSKKSDPIPTDCLPELNRHLGHLISDDESYPNPLDFVIPIWETMWRVVAPSVAYALDSSYTFSTLHESPTPKVFRQSDETHPSPEWFVTEVMRLHPPSNRIARAFPILPFLSLPVCFDKLASKLFGPLVRREKADIGKVLRCESTWGVNAEVFDPLRFRPSKLTKEQKAIKSLPFGHGKFKCVAANWAPLAAAIISAAILDRIKPGREFRLVVGQSIGGREGWDGWSVEAAA